MTSASTAGGTGSVSGLGTKIPACHFVKPTKKKKITKLISNVRKTFFCRIAILPVCVEIIYSIWNQKSKGNQSVIPLAPHVT